MKDFNGKDLNVGDEVYYARKCSYSASSEILLLIITKIVAGIVYMGSYKAKYPNRQLIKND